MSSFYKSYYSIDACHLNRQTHPHANTRIPQIPGLQPKFPNHSPAHGCCCDNQWIATLSTQVELFGFPSKDDILVINKKMTKFLCNQRQNPASTCMTKCTLVIVLAVFLLVMPVVLYTAGTIFSSDHGWTSKFTTLSTAILAASTTIVLDVYSHDEYDRSGALPKMSSMEGNEQRKLVIASLADSTLTKDISTDTTKTTTNQKMMTTTTTTKSGLCGRVPTLGDKSATQLWIQNMARIHAASRLDDDTNYLRYDFTAKLLALITPRLEHSIKSATKDWNLVSRILEKADQRYQYLLRQKLLKQQQQASPNNVEDRIEDMDDPATATHVPPPIRITVMGGSVTLGIQCRTGIPGHEYHDSTTRYCAWAHRLESLINSFFDVGQLVEVQNEAVGATNTNIGTTILKYNVIPSILHESDILINAYSTNDAGHATRNNKDKFFHWMQDFVRLVLSPPQQAQHCRGTASKPHRHHRPLLIHVNDVVTPLYTPIRQYAALRESVSLLADYYGFVSLSYPDMVRDYVYGSPKETYFSSNEFPKGSYHYDIHPGQGMHISMSWMVSFLLLHVTTSYCTLKNGFWLNPDSTILHDRSSQQLLQLTDGDENDLYFSYTVTAEYNSTTLSKTTPLRSHMGAELKAEGVKPQLMAPQGLPPMLDSKLTTTELHTMWKRESEKLQLLQNQPCPTVRTDSQAEICPFSWICGHDQTKNATWVQDHVVSRMTNSSTWQLETHYTFRKMGLTPPFGEVGAVMELEFDLPMSKRQDPIQTLLIFYLKSYGDNWMDSRSLLEVYSSSTQSKISMPNTVNWQFLVATELEGFHDKKSSEMYAQSLSLDYASSILAESTKKLQIRATLLDGKTFKIMGIALCH